MLHVLPAGARRGATTELKIAGLNLKNIDRVMLGDSLAEGKVVAANVVAGNPESLTVQMAVPAAVPPGRYPLRAFAGSVEAPLQVQIVVSDLEEKLATPARSRSCRSPRRGCGRCATATSSA
jgi:hypothetical protein